MDNSFSTVSQRIKQRPLAEFLTQENGTSIEIRRRPLAFYGEDAVGIGTMRWWMSKSTDIGGNLDPNDEMLSGRPANANQIWTGKLERRIVK